MGRRAGSKSRVRLCVEHHDESICVDRDSSAAVRLRATPMGPPHLGQRQSVALPAGAFRWRKRIAAIARQQPSGQQEAVASKAVGEQSEVADAHKALWQHVEEEAAQELGGIESHDALLAAMGIILPAKADALSVEGQQAVIGNGHAMGVAAQVAEHM